MGLPPHFPFPVLPWKRFLSMIVARQNLLQALLIGGLAAVLPGAAVAQDFPPPNRGGLTESMGLPKVWHWALGASGGIHRREVNETAFYGFASLYRDIVNPAVAGLGIAGELYGGRRGTFENAGDGWDGGARLGIRGPVLRMQFGGDYNIEDREWDFFVSFIHPIKRGGILVDGGKLRVDYLPGRGHSFLLGVQIPVGDRYAGRTRPKQDWVVLRDDDHAVIPYAPSGELLEAVGNARDLASWINRLTVPFMDQWDSDWDKAEQLFLEEMDQIQAHLASDGGDLVPGPRTPMADVEAYHREMERAFSMATSGSDLPLGRSTPLGVEVWTKAREIILDQVIFPYNRLLGRKKKNDSTKGYGARASAAFYEWLTSETPIQGQYARPTAWLFAEALTTVEEVRAQNAAVWGHSRFVWIPYQLALKPAEHDSQRELDDLVQRAVGQTFQQGNEIAYVENEQFQVEVGRMIRDARDHHVLWIHDVKGVNAEGNPDFLTFAQVVGAYFPALIDAVRSYDQTGKIPQYLIILDQWFYQANKGKLWLELLMDPMNFEMDLPDEFSHMADTVAVRQAELREAVQNSSLLQAQALHFPPGWIENLVKVHVNITNPADAVFWTSEILPLIGLPDMIARDHRKISFVDILEEDPYTGRAMYTGMGVGEEYTGARWEDRALLVQGPALLSLKRAARQVLLNQGFSEDEIPYSLKPRPLGEGYAEAVAEELDRRVLLDESDEVYASRAMQVHNQVGYTPKWVNVMKATLYTLMPPGSVIKAPDSLWNLPLWGSMMMGNALRGGRSVIIAPSIAHAPSAGFPQMSRAQELLGRLVLSGAVFDDYLARTGGLLKVGLYDPPTDAGDIPGKMQGLSRTLDENPWLTELYGLDEATIVSIDRLARQLEEGGFDRTYWVDQTDTVPKLHLKAHFFATPEAWDGLLSGPAAELFLTAFFRALAQQNQALSERVDAGMTMVTDAIVPPGTAMALSHIEPKPADVRERMAMFLTVGSHNQNYRSFIMDGEVAFVVAGFQALHGLPDFIMLSGLAKWIDTVDELEALFPRYEGLQRRIGRYIRIVV